MNQSKHFNKVIKQNAIYIPTLIPREYQQVEYLKSTSNQTYIDTGVPTNTVTEFEITLRTVWTSDGMFLFGAQQKQGSDANYNLWAARGETGIGYNISPNYGVYWYNATNNDIVTQNIKLNNGTCTISDENGVVYTGSYNKTRIDSLSSTFYIFNMHTYTATTRVGDCYVYAAKLYTGNILTRDLIPCYRKSDSKPGMYDLVTNTFFTNVGTGTDFTVGAKV